LVTGHDPRGDIPKHLMTRLHSGDSIPPMGTKEWFDLIYWDDPKYDYAALKVKIEKQEAKGQCRRVPGVGPFKQEGERGRRGRAEGRPPPQEGQRVLVVQEDFGVQEVEVGAVPGLEDPSFVLLDPAVEPLQSVFLPYAAL
jgi:hypothetical protein